jgi:sugar lactone lactonase YvrE
VFVDGAGNILIADTLNHRIRKVNTTGAISTIAGNGTGGFGGDNGPATIAELDEPAGVCVDATNNIFIADTLNHRIRAVDSNGVITTVAGNGTPGFAGDNGPATSASLASPFAVFVHAGTLLIADKNNSRIRNVDASATITTVAGNGSNEGDGGPATNALLGRPLAAKPDANGNLFISDTGHSAVREVFGPNPPTGQLPGNIATIAGTITGLGVAVAGSFVDSAGNVLVANGSNMILKVAPNGVVTSVAGGGTSPGTCPGSTNAVGDGCVATSASLTGPADVSEDSAGNIFIADQGDQRIRRVDHATLIITTVAGNGVSGFAGDNGPATSANLTFPASVVVDAGGNMFIADTGNNRIRKVNAAGIITTIAGNGTSSIVDGGPATSTGFVAVNGLALDEAGNLYVADANGTVSNRIRKIDHASQIISTIAGNGAPGFAGDNGPAFSASLNFVNGVAVDARGNIFITDSDNNRIREVITFPVANANTLSMPANTTLNLTLSGASPRGNVPLTFGIASSPAQGTLSNFSPSAGTVTYTSAATFTGSDSFTFSVNDGNVSSSAAAVSIRVFDFSLDPASGATTSATVAAGQTANYRLQLGIVNGAPGDQFIVTVSCNGAPGQSSCSGPTSPVTLVAGAPAAVAISVATTANAQVISEPHAHRQNPNGAWPVALLAALILYLELSLRGRREACSGRIAWVRSPLIVPALLLMTAMTLSGCGGGGAPIVHINGTPAGTYTLTVNARSGNLAHSIQLTLTVQ